MREWLTVAEAAVLIGRGPRTIYRWIDGKKLTPDIDDDGTMRVAASKVREVEATTKRGRPKKLHTE